MNLSIGLLDFREEKRLDEMFIASAFRIGSLYPETTFSPASTQVDFLKNQVFEMAMEGDKLKEKAMFKEKIHKAELRIKEAMKSNSSINFRDSYDKAVEQINKDLSTRKTVMKQKLFSRNSDAKILKAANIGSAFSMERAGKDMKSIPLNRKILTMSPVAIMPYVVVDKSTDLSRKIRSAYNSLLSKFVSSGQQTDSVMELIESKARSKSETKIFEQASQVFVDGMNPEYFNEILKKHKDQEMSPELPTKTNKPKLNL